MKTCQAETFRMQLQPLKGWCICLCIFLMFVLNRVLLTQDLHCWINEARIQQNKPYLHCLFLDAEARSVQKVYSVAKKSQRLPTLINGQ